MEIIRCYVCEACVGNECRRYPPTHHGYPIINPLNIGCLEGRKKHATKEGEIKENDIQEHKGTEKSRKTPKTSRRNRAGSGQKIGKGPAFKKEAKN